MRLIEPFQGDPENALKGPNQSPGAPPPVGKIR